jgi:hypothetical protein
LIVIVATAAVVVWVQTGPVPDDLFEALAVYIGAMLGFPWGLMFSGWSLFLGLPINAAILFAIGLLLDSRRTAA